MTYLCNYWSRTVLCGPEQIQLEISCEKFVFCLFVVCVVGEIRCRSMACHGYLPKNNINIYYYHQLLSSFSFISILFFHIVFVLRRIVNTFGKFEYKYCFAFLFWCLNVSIAVYILLFYIMSIKFYGGNVIFLISLWNVWTGMLS